MRIYRANVGTEVRRDFGIELVAGMNHFPETQAHSKGLQQLNVDLSNAHDDRRALRIPVLEARAELRFVGFASTKAIRSCANSARIADGGRRGPISRALFPEGVNQVANSSGRGLIKRVEDLIHRLEDCTLPKIDEFRDEWLPKLDAPLANIEAALTKFDAAKALHKKAFRAEVALRQAHRREVDRVMGIVRSAFPEDRFVQDVIFPDLREIESAETEAEAANAETAPAVKDAATPA